jgi:hypothetical protein
MVTDEGTEVISPRQYWIVNQLLSIPDPDAGAFAQVLPLIVTVELVPTSRISSTLPPQSPYPLRLVTWMSINRPIWGHCDSIAATVVCARQS